MRNHNQLQPSQNLLISDPVAELHRISNQDDQNNTPTRMVTNALPKFGFSNHLLSPKIFNKKLPAGLDSTEEISEWTGIPRKQLTHSKANSKSTSKQPMISTRSVQFQNWLKNRTPETEGQFLSITDLCHRYTFINQHSSFKDLSIFQGEFGMKKQLRPNNIQIKLEIPQQYMMMSKYKTSPKFKKSSEKSEKRFRLPQILKMDSEGQNSSNLEPSEQVKNLLEYIKRSTSNKKVPDQSPKKTEKIRRNQSIIHERNNGVKQKINWKGVTKNREEIGFQKMFENRFGKAEGKDKGRIRYSPLFLNESTSEYKEKRQSLKKSQGPRERSRLSKSLQQCLILAKKQ